VDASYYEVRCERCRTSFAPGTRRCIHCGQPIGRQLFGGMTAVEPELAGEPAAAPSSGAPARAGRGRGVLWTVLAVIAVLSSLARTCAAGS
jgi:hypothetical protein